MNKHHTYLLLAALAQMTISTHAMELDAPNLEEAKDPYAILKPQLTQQNRLALTTTVDKILNCPDAACAIASHKAVMALVHDGNPLERDNADVQDRKFCRQEVKKLASKEAAAIALADDLSGSEDESPTMTLTDKVNKTVKRVYLRNARLETLAKLTVTAQKELDALKLEEGKRNVELGRVVSERKPHTDSLSKHQSEKMQLEQEQERNAKIAADAGRLEMFILEKVGQEPLFNNLKKALFLPPIEAAIVEREVSIKSDLAKIVALIAQIQGNIAPLIARENALKDLQAQNRLKQADLERALQSKQASIEYAQLERTKLLLALDQKLEQTVADSAALSQKIADIKAYACSQEGTLNKVSILAQLPPQEAALTALQALVFTLKIARAQADGTYTTGKWLMGYYK